MKRMAKAVSLLLALVMVLAAGPLAGFSGLTERAGLTAPVAQAADNEGGSGSGDSGTGSGATLQVGDVIEFGTYPQTRVTDRYFVNSLDAFSESLPEQNYGYTYNGNKTLNMVYKDFFYQGVKYRGVKIGQYRPITIDNSASAGNSYQDENGYELNKWYYFKYEPLRWLVLDPEQGMVICDSVIDSQIFHTKNNGL